MDGEGRKTRKTPKAPVRTASPQMCDVVFSLRGRRERKQHRKTCSKLADVDLIKLNLN